MLNIFFGPGKTGSTWLYHAVTSSKLIGVPSIKETNVLLKDDFKLEDYNDYFKTEFYNRVDFGNTYIYSDTAVENLSRLNTEKVRIIIGYRRTKERAISMFLHDIRTGQLPSNCSFDEAVLFNQEFRKKIDLTMVLDRLLQSNYTILFWNYEWLKEGQYEKIERFFGYLGDDAIQFDLNSKSNIARLPKFKIISMISTPLASFLRQIGWLRILKQLKHNDFIQNIFFKKVSKEEIKMTQDAARYLEDVDCRIREVLRVHGIY